MTYFTVLVKLDDTEISLNSVTPQLVALSTHKVINNYLENLGLHPEIEVYGDFNTIVS